MNANEFIKDFIGDNEIVTVRATQLKELILQNQRLLKMVSNYEQTNTILRKTIDSLKQTINWNEMQKYRHIDLRG